MEKQKKILKIVQTVAKRNVSPDPDESLFDSGLLDSFALADLVSGIEAEFGVKIPDRDLNPRKFDSLNRIVEYLENRE
jgi:D-alanine--poly(phosphoribitol) ligase subunit 2